MPEETEQKIDEQEIDEQEIDHNAHLTEEQRAIVERALSGYGEQGANGYDLSMFREIYAGRQPSELSACRPLSIFLWK